MSDQSTDQFVPMIAPDGSLKKVPIDMVDTAIKHGGRMAPAPGNPEQAQGMSPGMSQGINPQMKPMSYWQRVGLLMNPEMGYDFVKSMVNPEATLARQLLLARVRGSQQSGLEEQRQEGRQELESQKESVSGKMTTITPTLMKNPQISKLFSLGDSVPTSTVNKIISPPSEGAGTGAGSKFFQEQWTKLQRVTDPSVAMRGSLLGIVAQNNARANRAITNLNDPSMVSQQLDAISTDIAGIMKGGVPDVGQETQQSYANLSTKLTSLISRWKASPNPVKDPDLVKKLRQVVSDIKDVDNKVVSDNLEASEIAFKDTIDADPKRWSKYKKQILSSTKFGSEIQDSGNQRTGLPSLDAIQAELKRRQGQ